MLYILAFIVGYITKSVFNYLFSNVVYFKRMKEIEFTFLAMSLCLIQWKEHALQILDLTYQKVSEEDVEQKESFKVFRNKVEEKYDAACEMFVMHIKSILPFQTEYNNWKEAMRFLEKNRIK